MAKRSQSVAKVPDDSVNRRPAKIIKRIPADLDGIKLPRSGQHWYQDSIVAPLRLRVSRRGLAWVFYARTVDGPRRISLGAYPRLSVDEARAAAALKASHASPAIAPLTFGQTRAAYFGSSEFARLAPRTQKSYRWILSGADYAGLEARKMRSIARLDLLALKDRIAASGRTAQNYLRPAQALFSWALDRGFVDISPAVRLKLPLNQADPDPYDASDLGAMVLASRNAPDPYKTLYQLAAFTGQRLSVWSDALWSEIDLARRTMTISRVRARQSKLKRGWTVPLSESVVEILKAWSKRLGRRRTDWLFGHQLVLESKIRGKIAKDAGLNGKKNRGTPHRFRATMLSKFDDWNVPTETALRMAGHASAFSGSRAHYIPSKPTDEMRKLAERYSEFVEMSTLL